jgi:dTDP-4-amino-4,6-dideoxygalactose transaminase
MIPLFKVHVPHNLGHQIQKVFDEGIVTEGVYADQFEKEVSNLVDNQFCSLMNSGTSALTIAYRMSNVGPGDEVITTPMTCMATNEPIHTMGAKIVFADIDPTTGNIDPESVKKRLTKKTKAVVGVHWAGQPFDIEGVGDVVKNYNPNVKIIEDAAHALGAQYKNRSIGSHSDYVCFSFQAIKHLTTVDGGAVCSLTHDDDLRIKKLRWFGLDRKYTGSKWEQDITESGYKFHMNNINAAIGLAQMQHINKIIESHKNNGILSLLTGFTQF